MMLIGVSFWGLSTYQRDAFRKAYGLSEQVDLLYSNSVQVFNRLTRSSQEEIKKEIQENPDQFEDSAFLDNLNQELERKYAYLIVRKDQDAHHQKLNKHTFDFRDIIVHAGNQKDASLAAVAVLKIHLLDQVLALAVQIDTAL